MKPSFRACLTAIAIVLAAGAHAATPKGYAASHPAPAAVAQAPASAAAGALSTNPAQEKAGTLAAQGWLALLDRQDWGTAWDASSAMFRKNVPLGAWMDAVPKVRQPFGTLVERQVVEAIYKTDLPGQPKGEYVSVMFASKFDKNIVQEVVTTTREQDGHWRVTGYNPKAVK